jgi:hypothetical protein
MNPQFSIFLLLVLLVLGGWAIWYFTTRPKIEKFEAEETETYKEKSTEVECKTYNLRQEVINIFELFLDRKPTVEEIETYSKIGNEQDIFISIMKDFKLIASSTKKDELDSMRVDACASEPQPSAPVSAPVSSIPPNQLQTKLTEGFVDQVSISKAEYTKLKTAFDAFDKSISEKLNTT